MALPLPFIILSLQQSHKESSEHSSCIVSAFPGRSQAPSPSLEGTQPWRKRRLVRAGLQLPPPVQQSPPSPQQRQQKGAIQRREVLNLSQNRKPAEQAASRVVYPCNTWQRAALALLSSEHLTTEEPSPKRQFSCS